VSKEERMIIKKVGVWGHTKVIPLDKKTLTHLQLLRGDYVIIELHQGEIRIRKLDMKRIAEGIRAQEERIPA
jgi:antitoxin component of MazEF toxin-antitoxin module